MFVGVDFHSFCYRLAHSQRPPFHHRHKDKQKTSSRGVIYQIRDKKYTDLIIFHDVLIQDKKVMHSPASVDVCMFVLAM